MDIALLLAQDGLVNGAIYALLALALVLLFTVTRVLFFAQGDLVTLAALTLATLKAGAIPPTVWLLGVAAVLAAAAESFSLLRLGHRRRIPAALAYYLGPSAAVIALFLWLAPRDPGTAVQIALAIALVALLGPLLYRLCFQRVADAPVLVLMFVAAALHFALQGASFMFFGPEGVRVPALLEGGVQAGRMLITAQSLLVLGACLCLTAVLYLFFRFTLFGKALRAAAINRVGARLVGIRPTVSGQAAFFIAALIGAVSGVLVVSLTTTYYDSGFLIGLNGFVGAAFGALASYPLAFLGALIIGVVQSFASFWASAYAQAIVFSALIPVLLWLSLRPQAADDEREDE